IIKYRDGTREVKYNGVVYSRINSRSIFTNSYWDYFMPLAYLYDDTRVMMIGLGGGTIAYQLEKAEVKTSRFDIIEVDHDIIELAKMFYPEVRANIIEADGSKYIEGKSGEYDVIILDAYIDYSIPSVFTAEKFVHDAYAALSSTGILAINYLQGNNGTTMLMFVDTLKKYFKVYTLDTPSTLHNQIIIASKTMDVDAIAKTVAEKMPKAYADWHLLHGYSGMRKS
ncbi:Spermine synthase, partial [mine drainage metagenome]